MEKHTLSCKHADQFAESAVYRPTTQKDILHWNIRKGTALILGKRQKHSITDIMIQKYLSKQNKTPTVDTTDGFQKPVECFTL